LLHLLAGVPSLAYDGARAHVPQLAADERAPLAGLDVLKLDNGVNVVIDYDGKTIPKVTGVYQIESSM
jgi:hypothetical protein